MAKRKSDEWRTPENLIRLEGWRRDGLDFEQIAHNIGIHRSTLHIWREKFSDISNALKRGSEVSTYEVENALYKSAMGYDVTETEQIETTNPDGTVTVIKRARKRHIPASTTAQIFILKNRRGNVWRDKQIIYNQNEGMLEALIDGLRDTEPTEEIIETIEATETINPDQPEKLPGDNTA